MDDNKKDERLRIVFVSITILVLFCFYRFYSTEFSDWTKTWIYKFSLNYTLVSFIKKLPSTVLFIGMIMISGFNPLAWSRRNLISKKEELQDKYIHSKIKAYILVLNGWLFSLFFSCCGYGFDFSQIKLACMSHMTVLNMVHYVLGAIFEEFLFKGLVYRSFSEMKIPYIPSIIITSLIFTVIHLFNYSFVGNLLGFLLLFIHSVYSFYIFKSYPSICLLVVLHAIRNMLIF